MSGYNHYQQQGGYTEADNSDYGSNYYYSGEAEYDQGAEIMHAPPAAEPGVWSEQSSFMMDEVNNSVSQLHYDEAYERLWVGNKSGRVTSLLVETSPASGAIEASRYCSFMSGRDAVVGLQSVSNFILSTMESQLCMHSNGGLSIAHVSAPEVIGGTSSSAGFSCSALGRTAGNDMTATHMIAGTKSNFAVAYDLSTFDSPVLTMDVGSPSVCLRENGYYTAVGCEDGKVRLLDGRLRSSKTVRTLQAHTGPCMDMWLSPNDSILYTCGKIKREINPHDPNSPVKHSYDPLVKVFDLRMNRQLAPLQMAGSTPHFIRFVAAPPSRGGYGAQIMLSSGNGTIHVSDPNGNGSDLQVLYASLSSQRDYVTSVAVSSSGQMLCTGTYSGNVSQFAIGLPVDEASEGQKINFHSADLYMPPAEPKAPMLSLGVNAQILASAYVLKPHKNDPEPLFSSFHSSSKLSTARFKLTSKRIISRELLEKVNGKDFIGTVNNPGFSPNSMLYSGPVEGVRAYAVSDPRNVETTELGLTPAKNNNKKEPTVIVDRPNILPGHYRKQFSYRGKARMNKFNYSVHNNTECIGLENVAPNSYTNTLLQLLFAMPEIRAIALAAQTSTYHHQNPHTLWCELGFLFHMMISVQNEYVSGKYDELERIVTPSNFQRTFQCIPEAVALGLFDNSHTDSQALVQTFIRFLFQQLHKEAELESRSQCEIMGRRTHSRSFSAVDDIFGFAVVSTTKFLSSNKIEVGVPNRAFALDLVYPSTKGLKRGVSTQLQVAVLDLANLVDPQPKPAGQPASFSAAIWGSLRKETSMRGWCKSSEAYEPFKQVRSMLNLPRVLALLCGETQKDLQSSTISGALGETQSQGSMHSCYWGFPNVIGGSWLPIKLEVAILRSGPESSQLKLIVSGLLVSGPDNIRGGKETWVIYDGTNDCIAPAPASAIASYGITVKSAVAPQSVDLNKPYNPNPQLSTPEAKVDAWEIVTLNLVAMISQVQSELGSVSVEGVTEHAVLHIKRDANQVETERAACTSPKEWMLCNDFSIQHTNTEDAVTFNAWRHPCAIFFSRADHNFGIGPIDISSNQNLPVVPSTVLNLPSQSSEPCIRLGLSALPGKNELVAFDAEFVTVQLERVEVDAGGTRVIMSEARQNIARVSLVRGGIVDMNIDDEPTPMDLLADDYLIPSETVLDYLTRFSGIVAEDLQPSNSRNAVVSNRTAYLKLRYFLDKGCIFVGHGLNTDFDTANLFVPKEQIIDTVELWRLPAQRKVSLRYLAFYFLKEDIQDEVHDSIEDARIALKLYRHYQKVANEGHAHLQSVLQELYLTGTKTNWAIGASFDE